MESIRVKLHKPLSIGNQVQFSRHNHILLILFNYKFMRYRSVRIFDKLSIANNSMFRQWCLRLTSKLIAVKCALNHTNICQIWQTTDSSGQDRDVELVANRPSSSPSAGILSTSHISQARDWPTKWITCRPQSPARAPCSQRTWPPSIVWTKGPVRCLGRVNVRQHGVCRWHPERYVANDNKHSPRKSRNSRCLHAPFHTATIMAAGVISSAIHVAPILS